jgi:hypothetical protein
MSDAIITARPGMRGVRFALGCMLLCGAPGCTIYEQYQANDAVRERVEYKKTAVGFEEASQQELDAQMVALSGELATRQLTARQLDERLAALQQHNRELMQRNGQKSRQRDALARDFDDYRAQVKALRAEMAATSAADKARHAAQQKELDALEARVHVRLEAIEKSNE